MSTNSDTPTSIKTSFFIPEKQWKFNSDVNLFAYKSYLDIDGISYWSVQKPNETDKLEGFCFFRKTTSNDNTEKKMIMIAKVMCVPKRPVKITRLDDHSEHKDSFNNLIRVLRGIAKQNIKKREPSPDRQ